MKRLLTILSVAAFLVASTSGLAVAKGKKAHKAPAAKAEKKAAKAEKPAAPAKAEEKK